MSAHSSPHESSWFDLSTLFSGLWVVGEDSRTFLEALCTQDILDITTVRDVAILDKTAKIRLLFHIYPSSTPNSLFLLIVSQHLPKLIKTLETFHFTEAITLLPFIPQKVFAWHQTPSPHKLSSPETTEAKHPPLRHWQFTSQKHKIILLKSPFSHSRQWLFLSTSAQKKPEKSSLAKNPSKKWFSLETWHKHRRLAGKVLFEHEIIAGDSILSHPKIKTLVSQTKGCYPGQEIVARVQSRGMEPLQKIVTLRLIKMPINSNLDTDITTTERSPIKNANRSIGEIRSPLLSWSPKTPHLQSHETHEKKSQTPQGSSILLIAMLHKDYYLEGTHLTFFQGEKILQAEVLPFPLPRSFLALGDENKVASKDPRSKKGLVAYHQGDYARAKTLFRELIKTYGPHSESLEALAVIAERLGHHEEAIRLNKDLKDLTPQAVMPYTNLSRLYMLKGWIKEAEVWQQKARMITFKATARQSTQEKEEKQIQAEAAKLKARQNELFTKALELDPDDTIALFSLGKMAYQEGHYEKAKKYLQKTVTHDPQHSAAWLFYGNSLLELRLFDEARKTFKQGMRSAKEQGNLAPLRAMEEALSKLAPPPLAKLSSG